MTLLLTLHSHGNHSHDVLRGDALRLAAGAATAAAAILLVLHAAGAAASRPEGGIAIGSGSVPVVDLSVELAVAHQLGDEDWTSERRSSGTEQKEGWKEENLEPAENEVDPCHHVEVHEGDFFRVAIDEDGSDHHPGKLDRQQKDVDDAQKRRVGNAMSSGERRERGTGGFASTQNST